MNSYNPKPTLPGLTEEEPAYLYLSRCTLHEEARLPPDSLYYDSRAIVPHSIQDENQLQSKLVGHVGQTTKPKQKPTIAPKPVTKEGSTRITSTSLSIRMGENDDTSTGDSGFVDAKEFRKLCPPTKVESTQHTYKTLNVEQREAATHYTAPTKAQG